MTTLRTAAQQALEALERLQNAIYNIGGEHVTGLGGANDAADSAEKPMDALKAALAEPVQDWDELEALRESLREHMTEIHRLRAELADHSGDATEMDQEIETAMADQVTHGLGIMLDGKRIDPASIYKQAESSTCQESRQVEPVAWLRAIDEAMVVHDCGVVDHADDYETAKRKLNTLLNTVQDIGSYFASSQQHAAQVVYQISLKNGAASSAWIDVDEAAYNSAKLYGEYRCRCLYTAPLQRKPLTDEQIDALELPLSGTATVRDLVRVIERAHGIGGSNG